METTVKEIVARFLKKDPSAVTAETVIDRSALGNSIMVHRLYASLAEKGIKVSDYSRIRTYNDLHLMLNGSLLSAQPLSRQAQQPSRDTTQGSATGGISIGIDIEGKERFPAAPDFRSDAFYTGNFSPSEISYCILQNDPLLSFAGLFAAKEAIVKADNSYKSNPFNTIEVMHDMEGKPSHRGFQLSISHTDTLVVAVALPLTQQHNEAVSSSSSSLEKYPVTTAGTKAEAVDSSSLNIFKIFSVLAFLLALLCTIVMVYSFYL